MCEICWKWVIKTLEECVKFIKALEALEESMTILEECVKFVHSNNKNNTKMC